MTADREAAERRSRWIPWSFVALFGVFLIANGTMVYFASRSWTGVETSGAYEKGLDYNRTIAEARAQDELGWAVEMDARPSQAGWARVEVRLRDRDGAAVKARLVRVQLVRPTHGGYDSEAVLTDLGGGYYRGDIEVKLAGQWDLRMLAEHAGGTYQTVRRVMLTSDG